MGENSTSLVTLLLKRKITKNTENKNVAFQCLQQLGVN
jgi:hypothetical protein